MNYTDLILLHPHFTETKTALEFLLHLSTACVVCVTRNFHFRIFIHFPTPRTTVGFASAIVGTHPLIHSFLKIRTRPLILGCPNTSCKIKKPTPQHQEYSASQGVLCPLFAHCNQGVIYFPLATSVLVINLLSSKSRDSCLLDMDLVTTLGRYPFHKLTSCPVSQFPLYSLLQVIRKETIKRRIQEKQHQGCETADEILTLAGWLRGFNHPAHLLKT